MLQWDETDFLECLEVVPERIEDAGGPFHVFTVDKKGIELELTVFPFEEDIRIRLFRSRDNHALFEYQIMNCKVAKFEKGKQGNEYLIFINQKELQVTVSINPDIEIMVSD